MAEKERTGTDVLGAAHLSGSSFRESRAEGEQAFSKEQSEHERRVQSAERKFELDRLKLEHQQEQERLHSASQRHREVIGFYVVVGVVVIGLAVGSYVGTNAENAETRNWAQGMVTLLIGGIVGGLAGYTTGKVGK